MRTYSSVWNNDAIGTGSAQSMINSPQSWSALTNQVGEWMQLDLGQEESVIGTVIQARADYDQYVTAYTVSTSLDGETWTEVSGVFYNGGYHGDLSSISGNILSGGSSVRARYVRLTVTSWESHLSLRADVLIATGSGMSMGRQVLSRLNPSSLTHKITHPHI